jgi:hypothetical protein
VLQDPIIRNENQTFGRKLLDITTTCLFDVDNTQLKACKPNEFNQYDEILQQSSSTSGCCFQ